MLNTLHPSVALEMHKIETQHRMARMEHRRAAMERNHSKPSARPQIHAVRRATVALAGAGLALTAFAMHLF
jgi:hypothetical protein